MKNILKRIYYGAKFYNLEKFGIHLGELYYNIKNYPNELFIVQETI